MAPDTTPADELAGRLKRTELQHSTSSIPGREIVQVLTEIPAGVDVTTVRYDGVVHDFMLLDAMRDAHATRAAIEQAVSFLRRALGTA